MMELRIGYPRPKPATKVDDRVRLAGDRACKVWVSMIVISIGSLTVAALVLRQAATTPSPLVICCATTIALLFISAFVGRAFIERRELRPAVAAAIEHYKERPGDFHPAALTEWYRLLTVAGVEEFPDGIPQWLDGPHARYLIVLCATIDNRSFGDWTHDRAHRKLQRAAADYAADLRALNRARKQMTAAYRWLDRHYKTS
jgi:hypothetical protein